MKRSVFLAVFLALNLAFSQSNQNVVNNTAQALSKSDNAVSAYGAPAAMFFNPDRKVEGSVYLFEDWNNLGVIYTLDQRKYSLRNIDLNIERNVFEAIISQDSIFSFDFDNIDKVVINDRTFKKFVYDKNDRVFELIYDSGKLTLLKGYKIQWIEGSSNPMLNRSTHKNIKKEFYFVKKGDIIKPLKLKKSNILNLMSKEQAKIAEDYAEKNKLDFKKDADVNLILTIGFSN